MDKSRLLGIPMKKIITTASLLLLSQVAFAQLTPVLHDADNSPIGIVLSMSAYGVEGREYVTLVSPQGYRAKMTYRTAPTQYSSNDLPGFDARKHFESSDCSGEPVVAPTVGMTSHSVLLPDLSNVWDFIQIAKFQTAGPDIYQQGDLLEYADVSYFIPFDAEAINIEVNSIELSHGRCWVPDPCDTSIWENIPHLLNFGDIYSRTTGQLEQVVDVCPNISPSGTIEVVKPSFRLSGFSFSSLALNDGAITGFENKMHAHPFIIKYVKTNKKSGK